MKKQIQVLEENWKRALADYQNLLRRVDQEKQQFSKIANINLIARLLPSLDIIELAAAHSKDVGVQMAAKEFHRALSDEGLQIIAPVAGDNFNHLEHECSETIVPPENSTENAVAELLLKGYKIGDYVLRPARVKVYKK